MQERLHERVTAIEAAQVLAVAEGDVFATLALVFAAALAIEGAGGLGNGQRLRQKLGQSGVVGIDIDVVAKRDQQPAAVGDIARRARSSCRRDRSSALALHSKTTS